MKTMKAFLPLLLVCLLNDGARADPAAWQVENAAGGRLWLFGSVHYLREQDHPLPTVVDELYGMADAIVMELDMDDIDPLQIQTLFLNSAMIPGGKQLQDVIDNETYRAAQARAKALGVDLSLLSNFEPWLIAMTLLDLGMAQLGFRPELGIERYVQNRAAADGKSIHGLETLDMQISIFDALDEQAQESLLLQTLQELEDAETAMNELVGAWRDGRLDELSRSLMSEFDEFPGLYDRLVVERNSNWIAQIETLLNSRDSHLVVVGALHLVGADSVIELLKAEGYSVTPVD